MSGLTQKIITMPFTKLLKFFEHGSKINCFPIRTSFVPSYITIKKKELNQEAGYIEEVNSAELKKNKGKYVLIDPGRRDIMFCIKETSTKEQPQVLIYKSNNSLNKEKFICLSYCLGFLMQLKIAMK